MAIAVNKNLILKKAKRIRTVPPVNIVRSYRFERKNEYKKFVKWISSADSALKRKKDKLPKKKDIKGLAINTSSALQGLGMILMGLLIDSDNPEKTLKKIETGSKIALGAGVIASPFIAKHLLKKLFKPKVVKPIATKVLPQIIKGPARKGIIRTIGKKVIKKKVTQEVSKKITQQVAKKVGPKAARFIPGFGSLIALGFAAHEFSQGDVVGGSLALASAIPVVGWAAIGVDIARDLGAFEGTPLGLNGTEKNQQQEELKKELQSNVKTQQVVTPAIVKNNFGASVDKFGVAVSDFKEIMSSDRKFTSSKTQDIVDVAEAITLGTMDYFTLGFFDFDRKGNNEDQKIMQEPLKKGIKRFWNWFVPPPEKSNEPSVAAGIRTPQTGFSHVESISNGSQLFGAGNNSVIMIPDETIVQSNSGSGMIPIPIPSGGGGGGVAVVTPSETEILNSLWTNILLTKLAQ